MTRSRRAGVAVFFWVVVFIGLFMFVTWFVMLSLLLADRPQFN